MKKFKTDFFCESSSFLGGIGSVLNICGGNHEYNDSLNPDEVAISHDWHMVGQDICDALEKAKTEIRGKTPQ